MTFTLLLETPCFLPFMFTSHLMFSIFMGLSSTVLAHAWVLHLIYNIMTITWVLVMLCLYLMIYKHVYISSVRQQPQLSGLTSSKDVLHFTASTSSTKEQPRMTLTLAVKVMLVVTVSCFIYIGFYFCKSFVYRGLLLPPEVTDWGWWMCECGERTSELCVCVLLCYVATQPYR